jgi:hypothetical protein
MKYTREDEELAHMPSKVKTAFLKLQKLGAPVNVWHQNNPKYTDYRGYFWLSGEECKEEWLDYYSNFWGSDELNDILNKAGLYFEWENPAWGNVYNS